MFGSEPAGIFPYAALFIFHNPKVMGKRVNGLGINIAGWLTTAVMFAAAIELVLKWKR